jgi:hypothetical protein
MPKNGDHQINIVLPATGILKYRCKPSEDLVNQSWSAPGHMFGRGRGRSRSVHVFCGVQSCLCVEVKSGAATYPTAPSPSSLSGPGPVTQRVRQWSTGLPAQDRSRDANRSELALLEPGPRATTRSQPSWSCLEKSAAEQAGSIYSKYFHIPIATAYSIRHNSIVPRQSTVSCRMF